jgi:hypothetical protein
LKALKGDLIRAGEHRSINHITIQFRLELMTIKPWNIGKSHRTNSRHFRLKQ